MSEICSICGLPTEVCVCKEISKGEEKITISLQKRQRGKYSTVITGFDEGTDLDELATELKKKLACGGTSKEERIELQGDHRQKVKEILISKNYHGDQIDVK